MPHLLSSAYVAPRFFTNAHFNTIIPSIFRKIENVNYTRERILLSDGDFLDLDWLNAKSNEKVAVIVHGLESSSERAYVRGMAKAIHKRGINVVAVNLRGCSGEINRKPYAYHSGQTDDMDEIIRHLVVNKKHQHISLIGFSLGGNLVLKYVGEKGLSLPPVVKRVAAISAPCDLKSAAEHLDNHPSCRIYKKRFLGKLNQKLQEKCLQFPELFHHLKYKKINSIVEFDNTYTAPYHHFKNAFEYYQKASCIYQLHHIKIPCYILNAQDDPILTKACFPIEQAKTNRFLFLETPKKGGHVGFISKLPMNDEQWHETRVADFLTKE